MGKMCEGLVGGVRRGVGREQEGVEYGSEAQACFGELLMDDFFAEVWQCGV